MTDEHLDRVALDALVDLDEDGSKGVIDRLCESFLREANDRVEELRAAVGAGDVEVVRAAAHRLKGSSVYFGTRQVTEACRELELRASNDEVDGSSAIVDGLAEEIDRLRVALPHTIAALRRARAES